MNKFVKTICKMSEATMQNSGYVRCLLRTYGVDVSKRDQSNLD